MDASPPMITGLFWRGAARRERGPDGLGCVREVLSDQEVTPMNKWILFFGLALAGSATQADRTPPWPPRGAKTIPAGVAAPGRPGVQPARQQRRGFRTPPAG